MPVSLVVDDRNACCEAFGRLKNTWTLDFPHFLLRNVKIIDREQFPILKDFFFEKVDAAKPFYECIQMTKNVQIMKLCVLRRFHRS